MYRLFKSFRHALRGIAFALRNERNFQVEMATAGVVGLLMLWLPLSKGENIILIFTIILVLGFELINTAQERVMDILKPRVHPYARVVKDVMAGAVLVVSVGAVVIGFCIFSPYFLR